jgi:thymidylate synthase (FAD)
MDNERSLTSRSISEGGEGWLGRPIECLDHGFVRLVDYLGNDAAIVQAARTSYGKGTKRTSDDRALIRYLMRHGHTTPFEMCELKFHVRVPMDVWRQWIRHRTASVNEYSTRYSEAIDERVETSPSKWRSQSRDNKQGSGDYLDLEVGRELSAQEARLHLHAKRVYQNRLDAGVAREQARKDLPLSTYTEAYWKMDLHNLLHFLNLRLDSHAQLEIREYAQAIAQITKDVFPMAYEAFEDYVLGAIKLSRLELDILIRHHWPMNEEEARQLVGQLMDNKLEAAEFMAKLVRMNYVILSP